jgi:histidyl-tRNA synthetase
MAQGVVTLKNMETGDQAQVSWEKVVGQIKTCLTGRQACLQADKGKLC